MLGVRLEYSPISYIDLHNLVNLVLIPRLALVIHLKRKGLLKMADYAAAAAARRAATE